MFFKKWFFWKNWILEGNRQRIKILFFVEKSWTCWSCFVIIFSAHLDMPESQIYFFFMNCLFNFSKYLFFEKVIKSFWPFVRDFFCADVYISLLLSFKKWMHLRMRKVSSRSVCICPPFWVRRLKKTLSLTKVLISQILK